jgi:energy-coupling factor transporter ATP-binding protein EcfA2
VEKGETLCVAGANGCGKSTLLRLMARCLKPSRGAVIINGDEKAAGKERSTGMVFQEPDHQLFMPTVWEDVAFGISHKVAGLITMGTASSQKSKLLKIVF